MTGWSAMIETPPRTWGRLPRDVVRHEIEGNTPTHVGKTMSSLTVFPVVEKHPHARGEDHDSERVRRALGETPPRTWGRPAHDAKEGPFHGNTPTHVGKTAARHGAPHLYRKHPHARGEDERKVSKRRKKLETPPRTWGRLKKGRQKTKKVGNTPTHVGKTKAL